MNVVAEQRPANLKVKQHARRESQHFEPINRKVVNFGRHPAGHEDASCKTNAQTENKNPVGPLYHCLHGHISQDHSQQPPIAR